MTGGAGFSRDAMKRTLQQRATLKGIRKKYLRARRHSNGDHQNVDFPESDPKVVLKIREQMKAQAKKRNFLTRLVLFIILITATILSLLLIK